MEGDGRGGSHTHRHIDGRLPGGRKESDDEKEKIRMPRQSRENKFDAEGL